METVLKEYERVASKVSSGKSISCLEAIEIFISEAKDKIKSDPSNTSEILAGLAEKIKVQTAKINDEQKDLHNSLSKYGKSIDKKFKQDLSSVSYVVAFDGKKEILDKTIALHFIREGKFNLAKRFMKELGMSMYTDLQVQFTELYQILQAMKGGNLDLAISWAREHRNTLERKESGLEFALHKQKYVQLLSSNSIESARIYAIKNFPFFFHRHMMDIQRLMTALLYHTHLHTSPYLDLLSQTVWTDLSRQFSKDFCTLLGLSSESPLYVSVTVGASALPTIIKMSTIMKEKKTEWSQVDELPVEISLEESHRFHSIFACPVSKEVASEENPPMLMPCGHVIVKESVVRLGKANQKFKCPYCPTLLSYNQCTRIYF